MLQRLLDTDNSSVAALLRVTLGIVFFAHGAQKVMGWFGGPGYDAAMGSFAQMGIPASLGFLAIAAEFAGGLCLIVGFLGRLCAFAIGFEMLVAVLKVHAPNGFFMNWTGNQAGEGFEYHLLAIAISIAVVVWGSGAFSLDHLISQGLQHHPEVGHPRAI